MKKTALPKFDVQKAYSICPTSDSCHYDIIIQIKIMLSTISESSRIVLAVTVPLDKNAQDTEGRYSQAC